MEYGYDSHVDSLFLLLSDLNTSDYNCVSIINLYNILYLYFPEKDGWKTEFCIQSENPRKFGMRSNHLVMICGKSVE